MKKLEDVHDPKLMVPSGDNSSRSIVDPLCLITCTVYGLEPYRYLRQVFDDLPKATTVEDIEALLPWNVSLTEPLPV